VNARRIILARAAAIRQRASAPVLDAEQRNALEQEAAQLEARARTARRWSRNYTQDHCRAVELVHSSCPGGCSTRCAEGVCTDAHS
jgi:hypothetical protein